MNLSTQEVLYTMMCYQIALSQDIKDADRRNIELLYQKWADAVQANGGIEKLAERIG